MSLLNVKMVSSAAYNCANGSTSIRMEYAIRSKKTNRNRSRDWLRIMNRVQWKSTCKRWGKHFQEGMFVILSSLVRSIGYDMNSVRFIEDAIPTIFVKQRDAKAKQISSFMEKLNRKRICINDNRVIL